MHLDILGVFDGVSFDLIPDPSFSDQLLNLLKQLGELLGRDDRNHAAEFTGMLGLQLAQRVDCHVTDLTDHDLPVPNVLS